MARVKYAMDRLPYFLGPLIRECIGHKPSVCFPNQFLKTVAGVFEDAPTQPHCEGVCVLPYDNACMPPAAFECSDHSTRAQVVLSPSHALRVHVTLNSPK